MKRRSYFSELIHDVRAGRSLRPPRLLFRPPQPRDEHPLVKGDLQDAPDRNSGEPRARARSEETRSGETSSAEMGAPPRGTASRIGASAPQMLASPTPLAGFHRESSTDVRRPEGFQPERSHALNIPAVFEAHTSQESTRNIPPPAQAQAEDRASARQSPLQTAAPGTRPVGGHLPSFGPEAPDPGADILRPVHPRMPPAATASQGTQPVGAPLSLEPPAPVPEQLAAARPSGTHSRSNDQSSPTVRIGSLQVHIDSPPARPTSQSPRALSDRVASRATALSRGFGTFGLTQG